jgi:hypothetical protein
MLLARLASVCAISERLITVRLCGNGDHLSLQNALERQAA